MSLLQMVEQQKPYVFGPFMIEHHSAKIEHQSLLLKKSHAFFLMDFLATFRAKVLGVSPDTNFMTRTGRKVLPCVFFV